MAKHEARAVSRGEWHFDSVSADVLKAGALQRLATATERLANRGDDIHSQLHKLRIADRAIHKRLRALEAKCGE